MTKIIKPSHNSSWSSIATMIWVGIMFLFNIPNWIIGAITILLIIWIGRDMFQLYKLYKISKRKSNH